VLDQTNRNINHDDPEYRFAVTTLARISALFAELLEYEAITTAKTLAYQKTARA
jgi:hypothetical protein